MNCDSVDGVAAYVLIAQFSKSYKGGCGYCAEWAIKQLAIAERITGGDGWAVLFYIDEFCVY